jgi:hypothetical protein
MRIAASKLAPRGWLCWRDRERGRERKKEKREGGRKREEGKKGERKK